MSEQETDPILDDILTNPELIDTFLEMFETKLAKGQEVLNQIKENRKKTEKHIAFLTEKRDLLLKYSKFLHLKGFHIAKQEIDAHADEIEEAQKERLQPNNLFSTEYTAQFANFECRLVYLKNGTVVTCHMPKGHSGACEG